jgi:hypothetical protein
MGQSFFNLLLVSLVIICNNCSSGIFKGAGGAGNAKSSAVASDRPGRADQRQNGTGDNEGTTDGNSDVEPTLTASPTATATPSPKPTNPAAVGSCLDAMVTVLPLSAPLSWSAGSFAVNPEAEIDPSCNGPRYVAYNPRHRLYVAAIRCGGDPNEYKLFMAAATTDEFSEIADNNGHGQDHCELVKPDFALPDDDEIKSGGCANCEIGNIVSVKGRSIFLRSCSGEAFEKLAVSTSDGDQTHTSLRCGIAIP